MKLAHNRMIATGFSALDKLTGGFAERRGYVLHGDAQEAKTALALEFLAQGLESFRPVVLVTGRRADAVLEEAAHYGLDLSESLRSGGMLLFEYPPEVLANSRNPSDGSRAIAEFQKLVGERGVDRLVLDPATPLLNSSDIEEAANQFEKIAAAFSALGATTVYLLDEAGEAYVTACRGAAGVLRVDGSDSGFGKVVFEKWPHTLVAQELEFRLMLGIGLVAANRERAELNAEIQRERVMVPLRQGRHHSSAAVPQLTAESLTEICGKPQVVLIHPDDAQRSAFGEVLTKDYLVREARGAVEGLDLLGSGTTDALVLAQELVGIAGSAVASKLRQSGHNLPIVMVGNRIRRISDRIGLLEAGVDICIDYPVDRQLLSLHVRNLLRRAGRLQDSMHWDPTRKLQGPSTNCTRDIEVFCERAIEEVDRSSQNGLPLPVFVLHHSSGQALVEELSAAALMVMRASDLVYVGPRGLAVLLPGTRAVVPLLERLSKWWPPDMAPHIEQPILNGQRSSREHLLNFVRGLVGIGFPAAPVATATMMGGSVNGTAH